MLSVYLLDSFLPWDWSQTSIGTSHFNLHLCQEPPCPLWNYFLNMAYGSLLLGSKTQLFNFLWIQMYEIHNMEKGGALFIF